MKYGTLASPAALRAALILAAAAVIPACGGSSGGDGIPASSGALQILGRGGNGSTGSGGTGADLEIYSYNASDIQLLRTGAVNTQVNVPMVAPYLGTNPRLITTDTEITPTLGATTNTILGKDGLTPATGLHVAAGATLTLRPHLDLDNADGDIDFATGTLEGVYLDFPDSIYIEGTLLLGRKDLTSQADGASPNGADLKVWASSIVITSGGRMDASGSDAAAGSNGGNGGYFNPECTGTIVNAGTIDTSGGDGDAGGNGAWLNLQAEYGIYNTGTFDTSGGTGSVGAGGNADAQSILSSSQPLMPGPTVNLGTMLARGGDGATGGGAGDVIEPYAFYLGAVVNGGTWDTSGGSATVNGSGGNAGEVKVYNYSGSVRVGGIVSCRGGDGAGAGNGGAGGTIRLENYPDDQVVNQPITGGIYVGASIDISGGDGANGGSAGSLYPTSDSQDLGSRPGSDPILFVGYGTIDLSGGDGAVNGGSSGGGVYIYTFGAYDDNGNLAVGSILNEVDWTLHGGDGATGTGGEGRGIDILIDPTGGNYNVPAYDRSVTNRGTISILGGNGATTGGMARGVYLYDYFKVANYGTISSIGGSGTTGAGGASLGVTLESDDIVVNTALIVSRGGASGSGTGGNGGNIILRSRSTSTSGNLSAAGGNSGSGTGGNGATIEMFSTENGTAKSGTFSVAGGGGIPAGTAGTVRIDGINVELTAGSVSF